MRINPEKGVFFHPGYQLIWSVGKSLKPVPLEEGDSGFKAIYSATDGQGQVIGDISVILCYTLKIIENKETLVADKPFKFDGHVLEFELPKELNKWISITPLPDSDYQLGHKKAEREVYILKDQLNDGPKKWKNSIIEHKKE